MFDASLRRRRVWNSLGPLIASSAEMRLRESELRTHDFAIPFASSRSIGGKQLRVLLLDPSALEDSHRQATISHLDRFSSLTGGTDIVIAYLQSVDPPEAQTTEGSPSSLLAFLDLQSIIIRHIAISIPTFTVPHVGSLLPSLRAYIKDLEKSTAMTSCLAPVSETPTSLLSHATTASPHLPLSEHHTNVLSDLFPSFRTLSQAAMTSEGTEIIREYFDKETARGIINFWAK